MIRLTWIVLLGLALAGISSVEGRRIRQRSILTTGVALPKGYDIEQRSGSIDGQRAFPALRADLLRGPTAMMEALSTEDDSDRQQGDETKGDTYTITITDSEKGKPDDKDIDLQKTPGRQAPPPQPRPQQLQIQ